MICSNRQTPEKLSESVRLVKLTVKVMPVVTALSLFEARLQLAFKLKDLEVLSLFLKLTLVI